MAEVWPLPDDHQPGDPGFTAGVNQLAKNVNGLNDRTVAAADVLAAKTDAEAAKTDAQAARDLAQQYRDEAHDLSQIDTSDGVVQALVADPESATATATTGLVRSTVSDDIDTDGTDIATKLDARIAASVADGGSVVGSALTQAIEVVGTDESSPVVEFNDTRYLHATADGMVPSIPAINVKPVTLARWRKALATKTAARLLCVGDSTTLGVIHTDSGTGMEHGDTSYPAVLGDRLAGYLAPTAYVLGIPQQALANDGRWTAGSGWVFWDGALPVGFGGRAYYRMQQASGGGWLDYNAAVEHDTITVHYAASASNPDTIPVRIDGVDVDPLTPYASRDTTVSSGNKWATKSYTVAKGQHTISFGQYTFTRSTDGFTPGSAFIMGVESYVAGASGIIQVMNAGVGATTSGDWNSAAYTPPGVFSSATGIKVLAPDLTVIMHGINDSRQNIPVATYVANISALIDAARLSGDVIIMSCIPSKSDQPGFALEAQYRDALAGLSDSLNTPFVDIYERMGTYEANVAAEYAQDPIGHLSAAGYADLAAAVFGTLARAGGGF